uniref:Sodium-dependent multivitamin transporter n=1 Tax=Plectus sambesii TaxID=2011161 RepID=A0A914VFY0_9BILA
MGFMPVDILIFAAFLCLSIGVGAYHAIKTRRAEQRDLQKSATADFLMGGRKMPIVPIALSLLTTFLSGIMMLGAPAELYQRGVLIWVLYLGGGFAFLVSGLFFVPIFYKMKATSIYEYFELRFESKILRRMGAALFLLNTLFYMSVVMYAPAVALTGVTHMPLWPFILVR